MDQRILPFSGVAGLAAAKAALDPARAAWRADLLISSIVEVLASRGALNERELLVRIRELWVTRTVNRGMLASALEEALKANLVEVRQQGGGDRRWVVSEACAAEAKIDRDFTESMIDAFRGQVAERLDEHLDSTNGVPKTSRLTGHLIGALIEGSHQAFESVAHLGDSAFQGPAAFDMTRVTEYMEQRVAQQQVREALIALVQAALDPADDFGNDMARMIVRGQVMRGLMARRDLGEGRLTESAYLVLDTSTLFYILPEGGAQHQLLEDFLVEAKEAGCQVVVTKAVLAEWQRVWEAAQLDMKALTRDSADDPPPVVGIFASNIVVKEWYRANEYGDGPAWSLFFKKYRDIEKWLAARGVQIVDDDMADVAVVEDLRAEIERLSDAASRQMRTAAAAATDAYSAALVAVWRERHPSPIPLGWFIAQERLTSRAYRAVRSDDTFPLAMSADQALLVLSAARIERPEERRRLVEIVGDSMILNSFFSVATGYSPEDMLAIADLVSADSGSAPEELIKVLRADYVALASKSSDPPSELLRRRAHRRNVQSKRHEDALVRERQSVEQRVAEAEKRGRTARDSEMKILRDRNTRLRRGIVLIVALFTLSGLLTALAFTLNLPLLVVLIGAALIAVVLVHGIMWVRDPGVSTWIFGCEIAAAALWAVIGSAVGVLMDDAGSEEPSTPTDGATATVPSAPVPSKATN